MARGGVVIRGATAKAYELTAPGAAGHVLTSHGTGTDPTFEPPISVPPTEGGIAQTTFLVSGGQVVWQSAYTFLVSAAVYYIAGVQYTSAEQSITLDAAHATLDRIDVIAVDDSGDVVKITGVAAAQPSRPDADPATQLQLTHVDVPAASVEPPTATTTLVYDENAGDPAEWDWASSGSGWDLAATTDPHTNSTHIAGTSVASGAYVEGTIGSGTFDPNTADFLVLQLKAVAAWANNRTIQVTLRNGGTVVGSTVTISNGAFGFNSATSGYQQVAIPIAQFAVPSGSVITKVRLTRNGPSTISFRIDAVQFITGGSSGGTVIGITQDQADARYAPLGSAYAVVGSADATLPNERRLVAGSGITLTDGGAGSTLSIAADVSGPASSTDNAVPRWSGTGGDTIEDTGVTIDDDDIITPNGLHIPLHDAGNSGTSKTIDWDDSNEQLLTLTGNVTLTLSNPRDGGRYVLLLATGAGSFTVTWPGSVLWPAGSAPTITATASKYDLVTLIYLSGAGKYLASINQAY